MQNRGCWRACVWHLCQPGCSEGPCPQQGVVWKTQHLGVGAGGPPRSSSARAGRKEQMQLLVRKQQGVSAHGGVVAACCRALCGGVFPSLLSVACTEVGHSLPACNTSTMLKASTFTASIAVNLAASSSACACELSTTPHSSRSCSKKPGPHMAAHLDCHHSTLRLQRPLTLSTSSRAPCRQCL